MSYANALIADTTSNFYGQPILQSNTGLPVWGSPYQYVYFLDDFISATNTGILNWRSTGNNGGGVQVGAVASSAHPGIIQLTTSTATNGNAQMQLNGSSGQGSFLLGGGLMAVTWVLQIPTASDGTNTYVTRFGIGDQAQTDQNNGCYFECDQNSNANWIIKTASGGSRTSQTSNSAVDNTNYHRYKIIVNAAASSVGFYIDDVQLNVSPLSTNINTTNQVNPWIQIVKTAGGTARVINVDLFVLYQNLTSSR